MISLGFIGVGDFQYRGSFGRRYVPLPKCSIRPFSNKITSLRNMFYLDTDDGYEDVMGLYNVLYIQLNKELWDHAVNKEYQIIFAIPESTDVDEVGRCTIIHNYDLFPGEFYKGSRIFACALMTQEAKELESNHLRSALCHRRSHRQSLRSTWVKKFLVPNVLESNNGKILTSMILILI